MRQVISIGTVANDGTGDPMRTSWNKTNANFAELYGLALKALVVFNGTDPSTLLKSFNVSSVTDRGTGLFTIEFTADLADANYGFSGGALGAVVIEDSSTPLRAVDQLNVAVYSVPGMSLVDSAVISIAIF